VTLLTVVQHATIREDYVKYVAAVYGVVWVLTIAYVVILNAKLGRLERQLDEIVGLLEAGAKDA
jgi:CcmD family protein